VLYLNILPLLGPIEFALLYVSARERDVTGTGERLFKSIFTGSIGCPGYAHANRAFLEIDFCPAILI
jgi:hypothetical protein